MSRFCRLKRKGKRTSRLLRKMKENANVPLSVAILLPELLQPLQLLFLRCSSASKFPPLPTFQPCLEVAWSTLVAHGYKEVGELVQSFDRQIPTKRAKVSKHGSKGGDNKLVAPTYESLLWRAAICPLFTGIIGADWRAREVSVGFIKGGGGEGDGDSLPRLERPGQRCAA
jgi:hypothetical protein